jgi:hypothetical protein
MNLARLLCLNEPYFYLTLALPCTLIFYTLPPSLLSATILIIAHYACWNYIMIPIFEKVVNMKADRIEIENEIRAFKIKYSTKKK